MDKFKFKIELEVEAVMTQRRIIEFLTELLEGYNGTEYKAVVLSIEKHYNKSWGAAKDELNEKLVLTSTRMNNLPLQVGLAGKEKK